MVIRSLDDHMTTSRIFKLGQIGGALLMAAGVTGCILHSDIRSVSWLFILGGGLYGGCRLAAWLKRND
jgi:hypothetical protein